MLFLINSFNLYYWNSTFGSWFTWYVLCCCFHIGGNKIFIFFILSDISWWVSNLFLTVTVYCLLISRLVKKGAVITCDFNCLFILFCVDSGVSLPRRFCDQKILFRKMNMPHSSKRCLSTFCSWMYSLSVLQCYFG